MIKTYKFMNLFFCLTGCDLGKGCVIRRDNCKSPCKHMEFYPCEGSCNKFARCYKGRYYIQQCYKAHFNPKRKRCGWGPGHCTQKQWREIFSGFRKGFRGK